MTLPKERQASKRIERQQLIQDIKQQNPSITDKQLSKYNIDDLRKIKMATAPKAETEKLSQIEKYNRKFGTNKFNPNEMPEEVSRIRGMQYGGIADMSAAPMVKQQRQRKRRAASGFRAKYSKGGGVRASKYKL
jgi:hypothetical protein